MDPVYRWRWNEIKDRELKKTFSDACETTFFDGGWMDDVIIHNDPLCQNGFVKVPDEPGLGIDLNPDTVKAHLVEGEK